jgi:hypothetical protein
VFRAGDIQAVLRTSEEFAKLARTANELQKDIVGDSAREPTAEDYNKMVEKVVNRRGQEFGSMWDWDFPRPFDQDKLDSLGLS